MITSSSIFHNSSLDIRTYAASDDLDAVDNYYDLTAFPIVAWSNNYTPRTDQLTVARANSFRG